MKRIAIIGTGIAGLGCAYFLKDRFDITLFEQNDYIGGHTNTVEVLGADGKIIPIDTGFMVFNKLTYPYLTRLFQELNVGVTPTDMSFSVQHHAENLEWSGASFNRLFGQKRNIINPRFWKFLLQLNRFNKEAPTDLLLEEYYYCSVKEYVDKKKLGTDFLAWYLVPMGGAIWSTPPAQMMEFPIKTLMRFFHNHGFLGRNTQFQWYTVNHGAKTYVEKLTQPFRSKIRLNQKVVKINASQIYMEQGNVEQFDKIILACHADQALALLENPTSQQRRLLSCFHYQKNIALLHTDTSVMPKNKACWASWNYDIRENQKNKLKPATHYWMNSLQNLPGETQYFVSLNAENLVNENTILKKIAYEHPVFSLEAIKAQKELPMLNSQASDQAVFFCGSYYRYGFHEDAFESAIALCRILTGEPLLWQSN